MIKKYLLYYSVPTLLLLVVLIQLQLTTKGLNRWRGGGFGMYSEFHFNETMVHIKSDTTNFTKIEFADRKKILNDSISEGQTQPIAIYPSEKNIKKLAAEVTSLLGDKKFLIEVWKPFLQMDSLSYHRKLILRYTHIDGEFER